MMPSLEWNRKWEQMIRNFIPGEGVNHWGDHWGDPESFQPLIEVRKKFIEPYIHPEQTVLEIGSGGGRMTQYLLEAEKIISVDFNSASFEYLRRRFAQFIDKFEFYQTSGYELEAIDRNSIDLVFTFDVFVHIEPEGIFLYLKEIERVLKPEGLTIVHYGDIDKKIARENPGFSRMTKSKMEALIEQIELCVLEHDTEIMFHSNLVILQKTS